jgi:deoxycytidylate deaminase
MNKTTATEIMEEAWDNAIGAPCVKKQVGSVLMNIKGAINYRFSGFGGVSEQGGTFCKLNEDGLCPRKYMSWAQDGCWSIHSEQRALMQALKDNVNKTAESMSLEELYPHTEGWVMFVTHGPCDQCLKFMHHFGVDTVVYDVEYKTDYSKWEGKIEIQQFEKYLGELND